MPSSRKNSRPSDDDDDDDGWRPAQSRRQDQRSRQRSSSSQHQRRSNRDAGRDQSHRSGTNTSSLQRRTSTNPHPPTVPFADDSPTVTSSPRSVVTFAETARAAARQVRFEPPPPAHNLPHIVPRATELAALHHSLRVPPATPPPPLRHEDVYLRVVIPSDRRRSTPSLHDLQSRPPTSVRDWTGNPILHSIGAYVQHFLDEATPADNPVPVNVYRVATVQQLPRGDIILYVRLRLNTDYATLITQHPSESGAEFQLEYLSHDEWVRHIALNDGRSAAPLPDLEDDGSAAVLPHKKRNERRRHP